ncbi:MAG: hypothetical protein AAGK32_14860, partial [Actinomycetota bacterium]
VARLVAFGRFVVAADRVMPHDFHLQQQLLGTPVPMEAADAETVVPVAFALLARPQVLLAAAVDGGWLTGPLEDEHAFERAVTWVAAVNGVLTLDAIQVPAAGLFDTALMADRLTLDLIRSWGADSSVLDAAAAVVPLTTVQSALEAVQPTIEEH